MTALFYPIFTFCNSERLLNSLNTTAKKVLAVRENLGRYSREIFFHYFNRNSSSLVTSLKTENCNKAGKH